MSVYVFADQFSLVFLVRQWAAVDVLWVTLCFARNWLTLKDLPFNRESIVNQEENCLPNCLLQPLSPSVRLCACVCVWVRVIDEFHFVMMYAES